ncbi:hypothetical protein SK128_012489 [Halocaridina rubra]|uniref:Uncharacterized protein n=1 Tax=Halocaridina rubra TaxID=373956 RepID=A0AAN9A6V5_HALRR
MSDERIEKRVWSAEVNEVKSRGRSRMKWMDGVKSSLNSRGMFRELDLPSLEAKRMRRDMVTVFKCLHGFHRVVGDRYFDITGSRTIGDCLKRRKEHHKK